MRIKHKVSGLLALALTMTTIGLAQRNMPSPPATAEVTLAGKQITIKYSRPSMRGRKIMGSLVPYGQVWRTGANEATTLTTPVALRVGTADVPAGEYTLWTLPSEGTWKLIVNKETGQWGTNYDGSKDLVRVDMQKSSTAQPVEQFLISWKKQGDRKADLVLEWENTRVWVPVEAK
ncbi:MAG TPA: DUF2911 domain-containing protein [Bryobacteraceae bacterium]|nr:DUF2911 domain-containing protein [Bryobacteraceae bacterium]